MAGLKAQKRRYFMTRTSPGRIVSSENLGLWRRKAATLVPWALAMLVRLSPGRTVYSWPPRALAGKLLLCLDFAFDFAIRMGGSGSATGRYITSVLRRRRLLPLRPFQRRSLSGGTPKSSATETTV